MSPREAIRRLERLNVRAAVETAVEDTKEDFAELNKRQWRAAETVSGEPFPPYSPTYARRRRREGLQADIVDLRRTGDFYDQYGLLVDGNVLHLSSEVEYEKYITARYGDIWGLNDENIQDYVRGPFWAVLKSEITNMTGLTFSI